MQVVGLEPTRGCPRKILSLVRLPIPPHPLNNKTYYMTEYNFCQQFFSLFLQKTYFLLQCLYHDLHYTDAGV